MAMRFDPMTGEPIMENTGAKSEPTVRFDPMTGEPIMENTGAKPEPSVKFDPMTGEPIMENTGAKPEPSVRFDPMTGEPILEKTKFPKGAKIACGVAAGVAVAAVVAVAAISLLPRIIFGKNYTIMQAAANTLKENHLVENLNSLPVLESGKYTATVNIDADNVEAAVTVAGNVPKKEASVTGNVSVSVLDTQFAAKVSDKEILLSVPDFVDETLRYNYEEEKSKYFEDLVEDNLNMDAEELDEALKKMFSEKESENLSKAMAGASMQVMKTLDFEKTDKRKFTVNGKDRNCSGYILEVDEDLLSEVCDIYEDAVDGYMQELTDVVDSKEMFDEIRDGFKDIEFDVSVYIYKKQIAAIIIEAEGEELFVEFRGGNTPWENTVVSFEGEDVMELTGSVEKNVETMSLEVNGHDVAEYKYNFKDGDFELEIGSGGYTAAELSGKILHSGKEYTYELSDLPLGNLGSGDVQIQIKKGAEIAEIETKDVLDISTMSESDWEDLLEDKARLFMNGRDQEYDEEGDI